ncbi:molybdate transport system regulatory protein [Mucilaginibacter yixingensis]|uniref:Molybdate transport system regulatory protein n=1 Tax=Mucilaginibacter yixingensis TaxID=1295612 RepID=A0A2T5JFG1_9SPHI|nr:LysR family transcriptional regulator [Mucilaginibacter yixingensis]PTR01173.1 molybdate transport system regulatory protein [Mucilaginibacter yixingensis]
MKEITFKLNGRIWMEIDGEQMLGPGRVELLERIQASGSLRQAAIQMKMSYKQAWDIINHLNSQLDAPVVISHRGGKGGGTAVVTDQGIQLIQEFHCLQQKFHDFLIENSKNV